MPTAADVETEDGKALLVAKTRGFSGAEIVACCRQAALRALDAVVDESSTYDDDAAARDVVVRLDDLTAAADATTPQITAKVLSFYQGWDRGGSGSAGTC